MAPPAGPAERHEPLPGLFGLPGHLLRQLSPRARRATVAAGVLALAGIVVAAVVLLPRIADSNREREARDRAAQERARAAELRRLRVEQRPRAGRLAPAAPAALIAGVEDAITRDAAARRKTGELQTPVRRTECRRLGSADGRLVLSCTAITSELAPSDVTRGVTIGYPYRAAVAPASGRYAICKTSGRPGEGSLTRRETVELPAACGG
jgi:hypothetical protein